MASQKLTNCGVAAIALAAATYVKVRLIARQSRALHLALFA
jgi:hypothetical protein